ncbi:MAG: HAD hydrolase-like protein [Roseibium sp.]|nr:HAD hydrolase-like protein [Roseibium sp.]
MASLTTLGFDADDTLWHNERVFKLTEDRFAALLSEFSAETDLKDRLLAAERRNLSHYGYGIKGFTLSMIETAIEVTDGKVPADVIADLLAAGREMLSHPVDPLPHVEDTLRALNGRYRMVLITKGDLFDQERKITASGLDVFFDAIEVVTEKNAETYRTLFGRHGNGVDRAMMIGNSLKSDILPALAAGAYAVHVPYEITWALEEAGDPSANERFHRLDHIGKVPPLLSRLA